MADTLNLPLVQSYHPTTFLERGVLVPFTTPLLAGTRARPGQRGGAELIVPNPSGARGVYILPWSGVRELCRPTVHDVCLNEKVVALRSVSPSGIRECARKVAIEGLAGRDAAQAAEEASEHQKKDRILTNFLLVMGLVQQVEPPGQAGAAAGSEGAAALQMRAKRALAAVAPRMGRSPDEVAQKLEELAAVFEGVGVGSQSREARLALLIEDVARLRAETLAWGPEAGGEAGAVANMVAEVAELTITCARRTLGEAVALTANVAELLRRWEGGPEPVAELASRPEWLLDGWEQISLLWKSATDHAARAAIMPELADLVPVIPREAGDWVGTQVEDQMRPRFRKLVGRNEDWRTGGKVLDLIHRNENFRALAA